MLKKIIVGFCVIIVLSFAYYTLSPLFRTVTVYDTLPITQETQGDTLPTETALYPVVGTVGHPAEGTVRLIETPEGTVIRYENYKTINGPDLFVYLSKDLDAKEFISLGEIRGTEGSINYAVPATVNVHEYKYIMTWCKQFGVLFNYVDIQEPPPSDTEIPTETVPEDTPSETSTTPEKPVTNTPMPKNNTVLIKTALLANGCFWCVERDLEKVDGVIDVVSGYAGGTTKNPTYEDYNDNGHREVVLVTYDAQKVTYANLVEHIIKHGDPTDAYGSFGDRGDEYAPAIYYENDTERTEAERVIQAIDALHVFEKPLPLIVIPRVAFWPAEEYHQDYAKKNPVRYNFYRTASGRDSFIKKYWGESANTFVIPDVEKVTTQNMQITSKENSWTSFVKPSKDALRTLLTPIQYEVTQEDDTEPPFKNAYDKNFEEGIYVDIVSGEPLFLSKDKYNSGTGWPSFFRPITEDAVVLSEDNTLFIKRTEVRSRYADSHLGHVFDDGPKDNGGKRYCMNSAALKFIPRENMEKEGYAYLFPRM